jgi:hypothetical protein
MISEVHLDELCNIILEVFKRDEMKVADVYVCNPRYWINHELRHLGTVGEDIHERKAGRNCLEIDSNARQGERKEELPEELRGPWCRGAFIIIGYEDKPI